MDMPMITQERLKELLHYDPETGVFRWIAPTSNRVRAGDVAGSVGKNGYRDMRILGVRYYEHRLAWFYVYGIWPKNEIDHINARPNDNRLSNLREATSAQNRQNMRAPRSDSTSGYLGVTFDAMAGKWKAQITISGKCKHIGHFNCPTAAHFLGYLPEKRRLHGFCTI